MKRTTKYNVDEAIDKASPLVPGDCAAYAAFVKRQARRGSSMIDCALCGGSGGGEDLSGGVRAATVRGTRRLYHS